MNEPPFTRHVTPVFVSHDGGKSVSHWGSAVLLRKAGVFWLVSAAHVFATSGAIALPGGDGRYFSPKGCVMSSCELVRHVAENDPVDLCWVRLSPGEAKRLGMSGAAFLDVDSGMVDPAGASPDGSKGFAVGFPSRSIQQAEGGFAARAAIIGFDGWSLAHDARMRKACLDPDVNVAVICPIRIFVESVRLNERRFNGLSGGAIWRVDPAGHKLVGIVTGYLKTKSLLFGTRLSALFAKLD